MVSAASQSTCTHAWCDCEIIVHVLQTSSGPCLSRAIRHAEVFVQDYRPPVVVLYLVVSRGAAPFLSRV